MPGNLYVVVHVAPHPQLRRQETELYYELAVSITQAALGARVKVPTATGDEEIEIKAGTQPGAEIRLRGRGVPHLRRPGSRGDLHVLVDVRVPSRLTARQRELLEQLRPSWARPTPTLLPVTRVPARHRASRKAGSRPTAGLADRLRDAIS